MKIGILANSFFALPATEWLLRQGAIHCIAFSDQNHEDIDRLQALVHTAGRQASTITSENSTRDLEAWLLQFQPDVVFVLTFPFKISASVLSIPKYGILNFHFAPLPQYRGAEPVFWMIKNRVQQGAITVHKMDANWDTGPILEQFPIPIDSNDTWGTMRVKLATGGIQAVQQTLGRFRAGTATYVEQEHRLARYWPMPRIKDVTLNWESMTGSDIIALVNATNPWNKGAYTSIRGMPVRVLNAETSKSGKWDVPHLAPAGTIVSNKPQKELLVVCKNGELVTLRTIYLDEGYFPAEALFDMGIQPGERFTDLL